MSNLSDNPEFRAAVQNLGQVISDSNLALAGDRLRRVMEEAALVADPIARPIIIGQLNVLKVTHNWITLIADGDPAGIMRVDQAILEIQNAIQEGLRGEQL